MTKAREEIINILCKRDGLTNEEAKRTLNYTLKEVSKCIQAGEYFEAEEVFMDELGLEPDYLLNLML